jgi:uncharacterized protein YjbI with pentapeptide repeats
MEGAHLTRADFTGAALQDARFDDALIRLANFSGADLTDASGLDQEMLNLACGDAKTKLPSGLNIPLCAK